MRFSPLGSISQMRKWWAGLIFDVMTVISDVRWGGGCFSSCTYLCGWWCTTYLKKIEPNQHKSRASAARMPEQHYRLWPVTAPAPGRCHTLTLFQYGLIEIVRVLHSSTRRSILSLRCWTSAIDHCTITLIPYLAKIIDIKLSGFWYRIKPE